MSLPTHHARKSYSPLTLVKSTVVQYSPRRKVAIPCAALGAILLLFLHLYYITTYPAQLIPPKEYYSTLLSGSHAFPKHMHAQLTAALTPLPAPSPSLDGTEVYKGSWNGSGVIPNRVFQTDVRPPIESDSRTWDKNGFERIFLDDDGALAWVIDHFGESEISRTYASLPKPILKADMLRYLVLLAEGGVYSDADTRALMPLAHWTDFADVLRPETLGRQPVRAIVSIEGDFHIWRDRVALSEGIGITKTGRHRGFQFVQWTMAASAFHPIMIDTVRRIVDTKTVAKAWEIEHTRKTQALEAAGSLRQAEDERKVRKPWDADRKGDSLSIQEWTGPAVFTDAVLSYLLATAGIREWDLYRLKNPLQISDVLILPMDGFNPQRASLPNPMARVIHLFRGSWKDPWPLGLDKLTKSH